MQIFTPIQARSQKDALRLMASLKGKTDGVELWLDHIRDLDIEKLLVSKPLPVIAVCKRASEKGLFKGSREELAEILMQAAGAGADYIDVPWDLVKKTKTSPPRIGGLQGVVNANTKYKQQKAKVIISFHDFKKTGSIESLRKKALEMRKQGADIVKIACLARSLADTLNIIALAQQLRAEGIPHILITMGSLGKLSRVLTPFLGGTIMFAPIDQKAATASGQLTVKELRSAWKLIKL